MSIEPLQPFLPYTYYLERGYSGITEKYLTGYSVDKYLECYLQRDAYIREFGFVLATQETMAALATVLASRGEVLDAGCGSGYLAAELARRGVPTFAVDTVDPVAPRAEGSGYPMRTRFQLDAQGDAAKYVDKRFGAVLLAWPPLGRRMAFEVASAMLKGQLLVYQGEGEGGCTADDEFYRFTGDTDLWQPLPTVETLLNERHVTWGGLHDSWRVWERVSR